MKNPTKVITGPNTRWGYVNVWEPKSINGGNPVYSLTLIIPKSDIKTMNKIYSAIQAAYEAEKNKLADNNGNIPALNEILLPIRDGDIDRYYDPEYANCWFINATTKFAPYIFDTDHNLITDHKQVYSGVYGKANVHFYAFHAKERNQRGIVCCIDSLMKVRDGDSLGQSNSFKTALDEFIEDEKENPNW